MNESILGRNFMAKKYFSVSQVTKCCGISRATLLRLEKRGLIEPVMIDEKSGYRYYDNHNITRILQINHLLSIGLSYDEIHEYFITNGKSLNLLNSLKQRMDATKQMYEEMELRINKKQTLTYKFIDLPEYVCYEKEFKNTGIENKYNAMYTLFYEAIGKGLRPLPSGPLFIINKDTELFGEKEDSFICCIPLDPNYAPSNSAVIKSCRAFSCVHYGDYISFYDAKKDFSKKIRESGVKPIGYPRVFGIVAPYTAKEFNPKNYVSRIAIPIDYDNE